MLKNLLYGLLVLTTLVCLPHSGASGAPVLLSDLITQNGSIVSGDKLFDQFGFARTAGMPASNNIQVDTFTDTMGDFGIRVTGPFLVDPTEQRSTATISYRVSTLDPTKGISGGLLQGNPAVVNNGYFIITETLSAVPETLRIFDVVPGGSKFVDTKSFGSLFSELNVQLFLEAEPLSPQTFATASFIDQTFSQAVVPEPSSIIVWLCMALLVGIVPYVYRRYVPVATEPRS